MMNEWPLGAVELKVLEVAAARAFYSKLGLQELGKEDKVTLMGVEGRVLVRLREMSVWGLKRMPYTAGLYHLGLRVASEAELGTFLWRLMDGGLRWLDSADHVFSQSFYFADPDGNGMEVYADRPEEEWPDHEGQVDIDSRRLGYDKLLAMGQRGDNKVFSPMTVVGHLHLNVANLDKSMKFYVKLGMRLSGPKDLRMRYLSWDGYHHHLAINLLEGRGAAKVIDNESGIVAWESNRVQGKHTDPDGIVVRQPR